MCKNCTCSDCVDKIKEPVVTPGGFPKFMVIYNEEECVGFFDTQERALEEASDHMKDNDHSSEDYLIVVVSKFLKVEATLSVKEEDPSE